MQKIMRVSFSGQLPSPWPGTLLFCPISNPRTISSPKPLSSFHFSRLPSAKAYSFVLCLLSIAFLCYH